MDNEKEMIRDIFIIERNRQLSNNFIRNGRVNISKDITPTSVLPMYEEQDTGNSLFKHEAVSANYETTPLQRLFFSAENIDILQKLIAYHVWIQSEKRYKIQRQDDLQLKIVMKSVYLMYGENLPFKLNEQVKKLNSYVLDYCIPNILSNIEQYIGYKKEVSTLAVPLELPKYTSSYGTRTNPAFIF